MSTESLVIEIDSRVGGITADLAKVESRLNAIEGASDGADGGVKRFAAGVKGMASAATTSAGAITAAGAALTAFVTATAKGVQETENLARMARMAATDFKALSFATQQFGITAEDVGEMARSFADRLGDYATEGTGAFQDFADVMGYTKAEAQELSREWDGMPINDILIEMVSRMENAGASASQMVFALDSMEDGASKLIPILENGGKKAQEMGERFKAATSGLEISDQQKQDMVDLSTSWSLLTNQLKAAGGAVSANLAPAFDAFFNGIISVVPQATNSIIDFINSFKSAEDINAIIGLRSQIRDTDVEITQLMIKRQELEQATGEKSGERFAAIDTQLEAEKTRNAELNNELQRRLKLESQIAHVATGEGGEFSGERGQPMGGNEPNEPGDFDADKAEEELEAIRMRTATELEILNEKQARELELLAEYEEYLQAHRETELERLAEFEELKGEILKTHSDERIALAEEEERRKSDALDASFRNTVKNMDSETKENKDSNKDKTRENLAYADAAIRVGETLFADNKAVRAGLVVADAATGIMRAFADLPYPAAIAASASIAATGVAQLAAVNSATKGGGSSPSAPSAASLPELEPETSDLTIGAADVSGANQSITLKIEADDSDVANSISALLQRVTVSGGMA